MAAGTMTRESETKREESMREPLNDASMALFSLECELDAYSVVLGALGRDESTDPEDLRNTLISMSYWMKNTSDMASDEYERSWDSILDARADAPKSSALS